MVPLPRPAPFAEATVTLALGAEGPLMSELLRVVLERFGIGVVASADCLAELGRKLEALAAEPDVVLVHHGYAEPDAVRGWLNDHGLSCQLVVRSVPPERTAVLDWAEAGAMGLTSYDAGVDELVQCIRSVADGRGSCPPTITGILLHGVRSLRLAREGAPSSWPLTSRESEVARMLERGLTNKEIARELDVTVSTVKNHVHNILAKLEVVSRNAVKPARLARNAD